MDRMRLTGQTRETTGSAGGGGHCRARRDFRHGCHALVLKHGCLLYLFVYLFILEFGEVFQLLYLSKISAKLSVGV